MELAECGAFRNDVAVSRIPLHSIRATEHVFIVPAVQRENSSCNAPALRDRMLERQLKHSNAERCNDRYINFGKTMQAITFNQAIQSFTNLMDDVSNNHEPLIITHEHHKSVV